EHAGGGIHRVPNAMQWHHPCGNRLATFIEVPLSLATMAWRVLPRPLAKPSHGLLPGFHVAAMVFVEPRETERPSVKRGQLRNDAIYLILDLFGALGERGNIFLADVNFDPVPRLRPMPSVTNALDS